MHDVPTYEELMQKVQELKAAAQESKEMRERERHIKKVLLAIRNVDQLITTETDPERLIARVCESLTATLGYYNAWVMLIDESGRAEATASAGFNGKFGIMEEQIRRGNFTACMEKALKTDELVVVENPAVQCRDCPLSIEYADRSGLSYRLCHNNSLYGIISVSVPSEFACDEESLHLFKELAGDLAFALDKIGESRALRLANDIIVRSPAVAFVWKNAAGWPVEFASENVDRLFGWHASEFTSGKIPYSEVIHPDDLERVSREVITSSEAPTAKTVDHEHYRIIRRDGVVRWVQDMTHIRRSEEGKVTAFEGILLDVTERHNIEEELKRSREQFMLAVRGSADGIWDWNLRDNSLFLSEKWKEMLGYRDDELSNAFSTFEDNLHPEDRQRVMNYVNRYLKGEFDEYDIEFRMRHKDGSYRWILARGQAVFDENGIPFRMAGSHTDITERKKAEEHLLGLALILEHSDSIAVFKDVSLRYIMVNRKYLELTGYKSVEEVIGKTDEELFRDLATEEQIHDYMQNDRDALKLPKGQVNHFEEHFPGEDGRDRIFLTKKFPIYEDEKEKLIGVGTISIEITDRKRAEEELAEKKREFEHIFDNSHVGIMFLRGGRIFARGNQRLADILGYKNPEEMVGMGMRKLHLNEERYREFGERHYAKLVEGEQFQVEYQLRRKDGIPVWCTLSGKALDTNDLDRGVIWVIDDLESRKQAERDLLESNRRLAEATERANQMAIHAEKANEAKSEFLANMSHEIRTPLNGVIGMTELLLDSDLDDEQRRYAEILSASGESLLDLINDILDYSKIEAHRLELEIIDFDLEGLMEDLASAMALKAHEKGLELISNVNPGTPTLLRGDPVRLRQILTNLMGNAVKFTEKGEVAVQVKAESQTDENALLRFSVKDTGIGISRESQKELFQKFTQVDASNTRKYGGTGLGLAISKRLVELMEGQIGVDSKEGRGSEFWFKVRLEKSSEKSHHENVPLEDLSGIKALVVDDNATNREILLTRFSSWNMRVKETEDAPSALQVLDSAVQADDPFHLAVIDMQMPGMNGIRLAKTVREKPQLADLKMVILTSLGMKGSSDQFYEAGFDAFLTKPVRRSELRDVISNLMGKSNDQDSGPYAIRSGSSNRRNRKYFDGAELSLLLVEDNFTNQQVTLGMLKNLGLNADIASNGKEALSALEKRSYDLVLMDVQMPEMDGLEATRIIRNPDSDVLDHQTPIIAMTAHALTGDKEKCLEAGMNGYIAKPVSSKNLINTLKEWLPEPKSVSTDIRAKLKNYGQKKEEKNLKNKVIWDRKLMMDRLMLDDDFAATVVKTFLEDVPEKIDMLKKNVQNSDFEAAQRIAHTIKGASGNINAEALRENICLVEKALQVKNISKARSLLPEIEKAFKLLNREIDSFLNEN